jgi:hypothetical protein
VPETNRHGDGWAPSWVRDSVKAGETRRVGFLRKQAIVGETLLVMIPGRRRHAASVCLEARKACSDPRMRHV